MHAAVFVEFLISSNDSLLIL